VLALQLLFNGLIAGALYALITLGFAVIYNGTRIFHLAHGGVFAFGAYMLWTFNILLGLNIAVAFFVSIALSAAFGILIEALVYRPLRARKSGADAVVVASLGIIILTQATLALVFGTDTLFMHEGALYTYEFDGIVLSRLHIVIAAVAIVVFPMLHYFISYTKYGRAVRALADNPDLLQLFGVDRDRLYILIFGLGSGLAALAGGLIAFDSGAQPEMGFHIMFVALTAVIVGGVGYLPGAAAGGLIVGLLQNLSLWSFAQRWQDIVVFGALIVFLLVRPQGVFGSMLVTRRA
jgi:branched-chain amino acid transport system permease protein